MQKLIIHKNNKTVSSQSILSHVVSHLLMTIINREKAK